MQSENSSRFAVRSVIPTIQHSVSPARGQSYLLSSVKTCRPR